VDWVGGKSSAEHAPLRTPRNPCLSPSRIGSIGSVVLQERSDRGRDCWNGRIIEEAEVCGRDEGRCAAAKIFILIRQDLSLLDRSTDSLRHVIIKPQHSSTPFQSEVRHQMFIRSNTKFTWLFWSLLWFVAQPFLDDKFARASQGSQMILQMRWRTRSSAG
jgi:hypothetical protein